MEWNISSVKRINNMIIINGFNPNQSGSCLKSVITTSTIIDALNSNINGDFNEGFGLSVINENTVYIISVRMFTDNIMYLNMQNKLSVSSTEPKYFDEDIYMGLPALTFAQWHGMISTVL
jgi:hypothetical protein